MAASTTKFVKAFTEWDRRYREDPAAFESDFERIVKGVSTHEYGTDAAAYFEKLLADTDKY